jgi:hypothetical protein
MRHRKSETPQWLIRQPDQWYFGANDLPPGPGHEGGGAWQRQLLRQPSARFPPGEFMTETVERAFRREKAAARIPASGNISLLGREEFADLGQGVIGEVVLERGFGSAGSVSRR